jgi:hypothetical protein
MFNKSDYFRDQRAIALPVYFGLCHARHIYNGDHIRSIVQTSTMDALDSRTKPLTPVFSTSSGMPFDATTANDLFYKIIEEILTQAIQWDRTVEGITQHAQALQASSAEIVVFRTSLPALDLVKAMSGLEDFQVNTKELIPWITRQDPRPAVPRTAAQSKIAIVGMSCRLPGGATDTEKFWDILDKGLDVHRKIPSDRFDVDSHYDPTGKRVNTSLTSYGCFIDEPGLFDAAFFNMSPREALQTDPMQRLALVTAYEALERSGYVANR